MNKNYKHKIEIMAPAGSFESLQAAIQAGADSVYLGVSNLNMRARAANPFTLNDLGEIVKRCKDGGVKTYATLNAVMYDEDLPTIAETCDALKRHGVNAVIAHDMSVILYARSIGLNTHISTQANVCNLEAVRHYSQYADVMVLARELDLEKIRSLCQGIEKNAIRGPSGHPVRIEIFAHGALCVSIAGKCYMSLAHHNTSANRGECMQPCRRKYRVIEEESGEELVLDNQYVMSPKDLCTIEFLDRIIGAGVSILKIEGRGRSPEYVYTVTKAYKEAVQSIREGSYSIEKIQGWMKNLEAVYNRGFWQGGYYLGKKLGEWSGTHGSKATKKKVYVGKVANYFAKSNVGEFKFEAGAAKKGDSALIIGPTTGIVEFIIPEVRMHKEEKEIATIPLPAKVRRNDKLYILVDRK